MDYQAITVERQGGVATLTFNRPDQLNAMNPRLMDEFSDAFARFPAEDDINAIILTGAGRAFMAGADIKDYQRQTPEEFFAFQRRGAALHTAIEACPQPVIAAVNGYAMGGGMEFVMCCDIVLAARGARMGLPEIGIGLIPGGGGTWRTTQALGRTRANYLMMTGQPVLAEDLLPCGFVHEILDPEALMPRARELAAQLAAEPPEAIRGLKRLTRMTVQADMAAVHAAEEKLIVALNVSEVSRERVRAFARRSAEREARKAADAGAKT